MVREHRPDLAIVDVHLPGIDGIEGMSRLSKAHPEISMLVVTGDSDVELVGRAIDAGAAGFFSKDVPLGEIMSALRQPRGRTMLVGGRTLNVVLAHLRERRQAPAKPQRAGRLTPRELEVLTLMGQGLDPKAIALRLQLSIHTTRSYVKQILAKLEAHSQLEAVVQAQRMGVLPSS
jgi:DNA-binding NarL/FixJ family response regulator